MSALGFRLILGQLKINTSDPQPPSSIMAVASVQLDEQARALISKQRGFAVDARGGWLHVDASCESVVICISLESNRSSIECQFFFLLLFELPLTFIVSACRCNCRLHTCAAARMLQLTEVNTTKSIFSCTHSLTLTRSRACTHTHTGVHTRTDLCSHHLQLPQGLSQFQRSVF